MEQSRWVRIRYPFEGLPEEDAWLASAVAQHGGQLSDMVLLSSPSQRDAQFTDSDEAESFVALLLATERWEVRPTDWHGARPRP